MKNIILSVLASMAVISLPALGVQPAADNENMREGAREMTNERLGAVDTPHLYLKLQDMSSDEPDPEGKGSGGMNMNMDASLDRIQEGLKTGVCTEIVQGGAGYQNKPEYTCEEKHEFLYQHLHQEVNFREGAVSVDSEVDLGKTKTRFRNEMSTNSAMSDAGVLELKQGDAVQITSELMVDEQDVGKLAQCLVVAQYKYQVGENAEPSLFMLAEQGWKDWKGGLSELAGVPCELGENQRIKAYDGELFPGEFNLYFGYQLENGKIVYSPEAFSFAVQ